MTALTILLVSTLLQLGAAYLAVRLYFFCGRRWFWLVMACAILAMGARRVVTLAGVFFSPHTYHADVLAEIIALGISILVFVAMLGIRRYFEEHLRVQAVADENRRQLQTLVENLRGMVYRCLNDEKWAMQYVSEGARALTGYGPEQLTGNREVAYADLILPEDRDPVWREVQKAVSNREPFFLSYRIRTAQGELRWVQERGIGIYDEAGRLTHLEGFIADTTAQVELVERLQQSQKLEAVGSLAGGIAHDFNNLLTVICGYTALLQDRFKPEEAMYGQIQAIHQAGQRATRLTRQLLTFSRKQPIKPRSTNLSEAISETDKMLQRLVREDIELHLELSKELWPVMADPVQIDQILINLVVNAVDAMPDGGRLTIQTSNSRLDESYAQTRSIQPGPYVMLAIIDTGTGMDKKTQEKIFEPFFTTKEPGKGTGLGLATVHGIVKQHGGEIFVYSEPGQGTTFKIYLPRTEEVPGTQISKSPAVAGKGQGRILLVEDEEWVRELVRGILSDHGYEVEIAVNGEDAAGLVQGWERPADLLVTDIVMPILNGNRLAERLLAIYPQMRVLFLSGYAGDALHRKGTLPEGARLVEKPFTRDELLQAVHDALHETA